MESTQSNITMPTTVYLPTTSSSERLQREARPYLSVASTHIGKTEAPSGASANFKIMLARWYSMQPTDGPKASLPTFGPTPCARPMTSSTRSPSLSPKAIRRTSFVLSYIESAPNSGHIRFFSFATRIKIYRFCPQLRPHSIFQFRNQDQLPLPHRDSPILTETQLYRIRPPLRPHSIFPSRDSSAIIQDCNLSNQPRFTWLFDFSATAFNSKELRHWDSYSRPLVTHLLLFPLNH